MTTAILIATHTAAALIGFLIGRWHVKWQALRVYDEQMSIAHRRRPVAEDRPGIVHVIVIVGVAIASTAIGCWIVIERAASVWAVWQ